jgi:glutaminyl-tRNA synthetase
MELLEDAIRDDLNVRAPRAMAVLRPLKVTITNWPGDRVEGLEIPLWPKDAGKAGTRTVPLTREIRIDRTDFSADPPTDWRRLRPGGEARLMGGYFLRCDEVVRDPSTGEVAELRCSYDPESLGAPAKGERKKTTAIQWVSASHAVPVEVRLYDRLFTAVDPEGVEEGRTFREFLNPASVEVLRGSLVEPALASAANGDRFQFVRNGYFIADEADSKPGALVFNRIVGLKDKYRPGAP